MSDFKNTTETPMTADPLLGSVYSPNSEDKWKVIAIDIYGRIFLETEQGKVHFYDKEVFNRSFSILN